MLWKQFRLSNNLATHIRENKDFSWQEKSAVAQCWGEFRRLFNSERLHGIDSLVGLHKEIKACWEMKTESVKEVWRF